MRHSTGIEEESAEEEAEEEENNDTEEVENNDTEEENNDTEEVENNDTEEVENNDTEEEHEYNTGDEYELRVTGTNIASELTTPPQRRILRIPRDTYTEDHHNQCLYLERIEIVQIQLRIRYQVLLKCQQCLIIQHQLFL